MATLPLTQSRILRGGGITSMNSDGSGTMAPLDGEGWTYSLGSGAQQTRTYFDFPRNTDFSSSNGPYVICGSMNVNGGSGKGYNYVFEIGNALLPGQIGVSTSWGNHRVAWEDHYWSVGDNAFLSEFHLAYVLPGAPGTEYRVFTSQVNQTTNLPNVQFGGTIVSVTDHLGTQFQKWDYNGGSHLITFYKNTTFTGTTLTVDSLTTFNAVVNLQGTTLRFNGADLGATALNVYTSSSGYPVAVQNNGVAADSLLVYLQGGKSVTGSFYSTGSYGTSTVSFGHYIRQDGTGDPQITLEVNGVTYACLAIDNSAGDAVVIARSATAGTSNCVSFDSSLNATFGGTVAPASMADGSAPNSSLYFSTTAGKLVYKDSGGVVNNLY